MDHVVRKKVGLIICFILVMTTLCGCGAIGRITDGVNRKNEIETIANQMMQCIVDENKEELLNLYSSDQINNHEQEIYSQFDAAFEFINGKIISYDYAGQGGGVKQHITEELLIFTVILNFAM